MTTPDQDPSANGSGALPIGRRLATRLPDETLFSWCSRYHQMSVNGLASATCLQLFGDRRAGCAHDLPCRIDRFVERTEGVLGTADAIIAARTLLPYYWPFRSRAAVDDALAAMRGPGIGSLKYRLGLLTSALDAAHPLKACPSCQRADERAFGVAYWHRVHQLPTVLVCPEHGDPLLVSPMKTQQCSRFQWALPSNAALDGIPGVESAVRSSWARRQLQALAAIAASEVNESPTSYSEPKFLAETFLSRLVELGLVSSAGRVAWGPLMRDVEERTRRFSVIPGIGYGALHAGASQASLSRLLGARGLTHPSRYLSWVSWYFGSWSAFVTAYEQVKIIHQGESEVPPPLSPAAMAVHLCNDVSAHEHSRAKESRGVRSDVDIALADKVPIIIRRRPKKLKGDLRHQLIAGLRDGSDKADLARMIGVSIVTVTRVLLEEPDLGDAWHRVRFERMQTRARNDWMHRLTASAGLGLKALRRLSASSYAWLYRHDRDWLNAVTKARVQVMLRSNYAGLRVQRRDAELALRIRRTVMAIAEQQPSARIELDDLLWRLPELKSRIDDLASWPLSASALDVALRRDPQSDIHARQPRLDEGEP